MAVPVLVFGVGLAFQVAGPAQEGPSTQSATLRPWAPDVRLEQVRATARIVDGTATTEVEQVFRNSGPVEREEVFLFPLPEDAVVSDLSTTVDGKVVKGEL